VAKESISSGSSSLRKKSLSNRLNTNPNKGSITDYSEFDSIKNDGSSPKQSYFFNER
jgi:hypothetical protein